jgi:hypothetical protein
MPNLVQERGYPLGARRETGADTHEAVDGVGKEPETAPTLELTQKFETPSMLLPAGRLAALKKPGWPKAADHSAVANTIRETRRLCSHPLQRWSGCSVEHDRDVIHERRVEDIDGGLLILEEAVDLRLGELHPSAVEVVIDGDLHCVVLALSQGKAGRFAAASH